MIYYKSMWSGEVSSPYHILDDANVFLYMSRSGRRIFRCGCCGGIPHFFNAVKGTDFGTEKMHNNIAAINDDPVRSR